jgi:hypothetical protein
MADNLVDVRSKVTERDHKVLTAVSQATGREISDLVRELICEWASAEVHRARSVTAILHGSEGLVGSPRE